jgi:hypothetical protein
MLLCDYATEAGGKLYIMGAGWSRMGANTPGTMGLAIKLSIPWDQANMRHSLVAALKTEDGQQVEVGGVQVRSEAQIEVGRPPGLRPGTPLDVPVALMFQGLSLPPGAYIWELEVDGEVLSKARFEAFSPNQA